MYWLSFGIFGGGGTATDTSTIWTDGVSTFRLDVRSGHLFLDQAFTPLGFDGIIITDWGPVKMEGL